MSDDVTFFRNVLFISRILWNEKLPQMRSREFMLLLRMTARIGGPFDKLGMMLEKVCAGKGIFCKNRRLTLQNMHINIGK